MLPRKTCLSLSGFLAAALLAGTAGCSGSGDDNDELKVIYDEQLGRIVVSLPSDIPGSADVYVQTRRGSFGQLSCASLIEAIAPSSDTDGNDVIGPVVDPDLLRPFYGPEWAEEPTPQMLEAAAAGTDSIVDLCIVDGDVLVERETDLFKAWDAGKQQGIGGKADDPSGEARIHSVQEYGERCVAELGEIPFFESTGEGTYSTYNCLESTQIPMTVTDADGRVEYPDGEVGKCDKPQYIYSLCEQGPRVASRVNEQGTRWVLLCRKSIGGLSSDQYNDIAMIGNNPATGKTCYFQNALYQKKDGGNIPHPADVEKSTNLWSGIHGGIGSGIECAKCHDADAYIHTPWIDGAKDEQGRPIVPKMGYDEDYAIGANDRPYSIVNLAGQGWTMPQQLVSTEANACLQCHRMGNGRWLEWSTRLDGTDSSFRNITTDEYLQFRNLHWMPPELTGLTEANWATSEYGVALDFIKSCRSNPGGCEFAPIPDRPTDNGGGGELRNPVDLPDDQLALAALQHLGADVPGTTDRCTECHAITRSSLRHWADLTDAALANCLDESGGGAGGTVTDTPSGSVARNEFTTFGPYEVASGGTFDVVMTGSGDADLYVKKNEPVTVDRYDCRPYSGGSDESCGQGQLDATGPGKFYVGVNGYADSSSFSLTVTYTGVSGDAASPLELVDCMRVDPSNPDSAFDPNTIGIYTAAGHLGWFQNLFHTAYPAGESGNTASTWLFEFNQFKTRVAMPKGNHPRMTQEEFDIVAEWYARGLPRLEQTLPEDGGGGTCTENISPALISHIDAMATQGWRSVNSDRGVLMLGCSGGGDGGGTTTTNETGITVTAGAEQQLGPYAVATGGSVTVTMTGTGDADLYVREGAAPTEADYDCRPYASTSNETCGPHDGPGSYYVMVRGYSSSSTVDLAIAVTAAGGGGGGSALSCLASFPQASTKSYGTGWEYLAGAKLRVLRELDFKTFFWMRSSADGRFVANGSSTGAGGMISDLLSGTDIPAHAAYDPGFFPDNSGFMFQGTPIGAGFCSQDLLTSAPNEVNFSEPECSTADGISLYQHLGRGLDGGDYFVINGQFTSDNGGHYATLNDPSASFASTAQFKITPMINNGNGFERGDHVYVDSPNEGDAVLSPSSRLIASRIGDSDGVQTGYVIHRVDAAPTSEGYDISTPEVGRVCIKGAKPAFSFDERFMVTHHYVEEGDYAELGYSSPTDSGFMQYRDKGAANIVVVDLTTGESVRVTHMQPGQYALFPHFRSDGWIYFLVRDSNSDQEYVVASDAALLLGS
jgi:hypothetical protein